MNFLQFRSPYPPDRYLAHACALWAVALFVMAGLEASEIKSENPNGLLPAANPLLWVGPFLWIGLAVQVHQGTGRALIALVLTGGLIVFLGWYDPSPFWIAVGAGAGIYGSSRLSSYLGPRPKG